MPANKPPYSVPTLKPSMRNPYIAPKGLYPTLDSFEEAKNKAIAQFPHQYHNQVLALLGTYHNSLLKALNDRNQ